MAPDGPKTDPDGPKMATRGPKMAPRWPKKGHHKSLKTIEFLRILRCVRSFLCDFNALCAPLLFLCFVRLFIFVRRQRTLGTFSHVVVCFCLLLFFCIFSLPWPVGLKMAQNAPRWLQAGPRWAQDGPKMAQVGPKLAPRWAQSGPRRAQDGPRVAR